MPNLSGALKPSGHQLKKKKNKKTEIKSRDSTLKAKVNAVNYIVLKMHK